MPQTRLAMTRVPPKVLHLQMRPRYSKAIALSKSDCQVDISVGASASSATAVGASSSTAVGASSSTAGGASLEDTPDDELAKAIAASLEGAQC